MPRWYVWSGTVHGQGVFPSFQEALDHCRVLTNDHRRKYELQLLVAEGYRYVGPRGRRHGTRLVAYICTASSADMLGLNLRAVFGAAEGLI